MISYDAIEIADRMHLTFRRLLESVVSSHHLPDEIRHEAERLLGLSDAMSERVADDPDLDALHVGLRDLRAKVEHFAMTIVSSSKSIL